ncbi:MAG: hydroxylase [Planctomycetota bacterium]
MQLHYLEFVTDDVDGTCAVLAAGYGVTFGDPVPTLGNARTGSLPDGARIGVRARMHDAEALATRPYLRVDDIEAAVQRAADAGAEVALPPMEIPGEGRIAVTFQGGAELGFWQV